MRGFDHQFIICVTVNKIYRLIFNRSNIFIYDIFNLGYLCLRWKVILKLKILL